MLSLGHWHPLMSGQVEAVPSVRGFYLHCCFLIFFFLSFFFLFLSFNYFCLCSFLILEPGVLGGPL